MYVIKLPLCIIALLIYPSALYGYSNQSFAFKELPVVQKEKLKSGQTSLSISINKKIVLLQTLDPNGQLLEEKLDINSDGQFDQITRVLSVGRLEVIKDENFDQFFETQEQHELKSGARTVKIQREDPKTKLKTSQIVVLSEDELKVNDGDCEPSDLEIQALKQIRDLAPFFEKVFVKKDMGEWILTSYGVKINKNCLGDPKINFIGLVQESWSTGLACLKKIDGNGSRMNLSKIAALLANDKNPPKIICNENKSKGSATTPGAPDHPLIRINPAYMQDKKDLKSTLFHEVFHNCGNLHGVGIEYAYTCEDCCMTDVTEKNYYKTKKELGCELCRGNYLGVEDKKYLADLSEWNTYTDNNVTRKFFINRLTSDTTQKKELHYLLSTYMELEPADIYVQFYNRMKKERPHEIGQLPSLLDPQKQGDFYKQTPKLSRAVQEFVSGIFALSKGADLEAVEHLKSIRINVNVNSLNEEEKKQLRRLDKQTQDILWSLILNKYPSDKIVTKVEHKIRSEAHDLINSLKE